MNNQIFIKTFAGIYNNFNYSTEYADRRRFYRYTWDCIDKLMEAYSLSPLTKIIILANISREAENEDVKKFMEYQIDVIQTFLD